MALLSDFNKGEYKTSLAEVINNMDLTIPNNRYNHTFN